MSVGHKVEERPESVRFATPEDEADVYRLLVELWSEKDLLAKLIPYDPIVLSEAARDGIAKKNGQFVAVVEEEGRIVGTTGFHLERYWWSRDGWYLTGKWIYVTPSARRAGHEKALFDFCEWCRWHMAKDIAAAGDPRPFLFEASFISASRVEARERLWARFGRKIGAIFVSGLDE